MGLRGVDRYLLSQTLAPMIAVLASTMMVFLMERTLRSLDLLALTHNGFSYLLQLMVDLTPHYVGLTLPAAFFIALFVVIDRLNGQSEIDAMLATGMSLDRITRPFVLLGAATMIFSLALYGFIQPYSRYAYREVMHAARNAGWNGDLRAGELLAPSGDLLMIANEVDLDGGRLRGVFLRTISPEGREEVLTAAAADLRRDADGRTMVLALHDGQQAGVSRDQGAHVLTFSTLTLKLPLAPAAQLLRRRGAGEASELTLLELAHEGFGEPAPPQPRQTLLAELYSRLARAAALPLMPLLATPLAITAKRAGPGAAMAVAGLLLFAFQISLVFGQGLAEKGVVSAALAQGLPFLLFASVCVLVFASSRKFPGQNPVAWLTEQLGDLLSWLARRLRRPRRA
ncbi:LptF/LptG family permease [Phenylobacterium immobile]|uniref:LptF/LptG family permease n=1 Tax=Phenylobacterium immobile TaxID=21 RepID=UPI000A92BB6A|nr:LptF/LptG family permease [Phenylobacterium immobile]